MRVLCRGNPTTSATRGDLLEGREPMTEERQRPVAWPFLVLGVGGVALATLGLYEVRNTSYPVAVVLLVGAIVLGAIGGSVSARLSKPSQDKGRGAALVWRWLIWPIVAGTYLFAELAPPVAKVVVYGLVGGFAFTGAIGFWRMAVRLASARTNGGPSKEPR